MAADEVRPPRRWMSVRDPSAQARTTVGGVLFWQILANSVGVALVALYVMVLFPSGSEERVRFTALVFVIYVTVIVVVGVPINVFLLGRAVRWVREGVQPTPSQRRLLFRLPLYETLPCVVWWIGGSVIFGVLNKTSSRVSIGIFFAGLVTCAALYLLVESHFRPVFALALRHADLPDGRRDLLPRLMLTWALGSAVPIALLGIAPLLNDNFEARRMPWIAGFSVLGGGAVMVIGTLSVSRPLTRVREALWDVERGQLDIELPIDDLGEIGRLSKGVNDMVAGLRERERLREQFGHQVGRGAFEVAQGSEEALSSVGVLRTVAVLFVDLEGFTRYSERHDPGQVVDMLNRFFEVVVTTVNREGGWVNKFEGDAALCLFGVPDVEEDYASRALIAAARMRSDLQRVRFDPNGIAEERLNAGIAVATGPVIAGFLGTPERYEYTVIGDCVNLASRLCDLAKTVPGKTLVTREAWEQAGRPDGWRMGSTLRVRGRRQRVSTMEAQTELRIGRRPIRRS